jgi:hypothetical protein
VARPEMHQLEEKAKAVAHDLAHGCGHGDHHDGCGHSTPERKPGIRVSNPSDAAEHRAERAAEQMDAGRRVNGGHTHPAPSSGALAAALRPAGSGRPLAADLKQASETSLGTDLSHVRVHDDHRSDALSRHLGADGFSVGSDVYFRHGVYGSSAAHDRHIVNHELAHAGSGAGSEGGIARHASWEHRMLGDVDPAVLEVIASGRDMVEDRKNDKKKVPSKTIQAVDGSGKTRKIGPDDVLHALEQEIERQQKFAKMAPVEREKGATGKNAMEYKDEHGVDREWDVSIVNIPLRDGTVAALTYGEMNTLGDFYGSPEEISQTDPQQFRNYLYGIREEGIRKFMRLHTEIAKGLGEKPRFDADAKSNRVKDADAKSQGNTGTSKALIGGDAYGELKLMGAGITKGEKKKRAVDSKGDEVENTGYTGGLGRNACHFAPQSWHAWSSYHQKAKALAGQAWVARETAKVTQDPGQKAKLEAEGDAKENEALVQNGFGDHFLQDSFASGHLINKTLIMQWFVKWMDEHPLKRDYTNEEDWQRVQNMAYGQSGLAAMPLYTTPLKQGQASDAQSVDNMGGTWQDRFTALGLQIPGSVRSGDDATGKILLGWQDQRRLGKLKSTDVTEIKKKYALAWGVAAGDVEDALKALIGDGVIRYSHYSTSDRKKGADSIGLTGAFGAKSLELTSAYEPKKVVKKKDEKKGGEKEPKDGRSVRFDEKNLNQLKVADKAQKVTYQDYMAFLNHGYMQLSTNMLHNYFCENGLTVKSEAQRMPYKIYGDNNMLETQSAAGVRFSAETANMSRDAIYDFATTGQTLNSTAAIESRIPKSVIDSHGLEVSLANWHGDNGELRKLCWDKVFPDTAAFFSKSTFIASDALVSAKSQEKIMKDVKILQHDGEDF